MNKDKVIVYVVIIAVVLFSLTFMFYLLVKPVLIKTPSPEPIWVKMNGYVFFNPDSGKPTTGNKPPFVQVYYPYQNPNFLCNGRSISLANITWLNETHGTYTIYFYVPIPMGVFVTTECYGCLYKSVSINQDTQTIELNIPWDERTCYSETSYGNNPAAIYEKTDIFLTGIDEELSGKDFNATDRQSVRDLIQFGKGSITESKRNSNNLNESLLDALYAEWYAWDAKYLMSYFDLKYCVDKTNDILRNYNDPFCYSPDYGVLQNFNDVNNSFAYNNYRRMSPNDIREIEPMKKEINNVYNDYRWLSDAEFKCSESFSIINKTFEFQAGKCEDKKTSLNLFNFMFKFWIMIFLVGIGMIIGKYIYTKKL